MRRPRLTYANVVSSIALFVALGGTGYAVTKLPRNSVGTTQIKANAVTSGKIRKGAVQRSDLAPSVRPGASSSATRGPRGPEGPAGSKGDTGPSETIQVRRPAVAGISADPGGSALIASLTVPPGSWLLDANTTIVYGPTPPQSDFFDCILQTAASDVLVKGVLRVGDDPGSVTAGHIPIHVAATFGAATQVRFICSHAGPVAANQGQPYADRSTLQATRIGQLTDLPAPGN